MSDSNDKLLLIMTVIIICLLGFNVLQRVHTHKLNVEKRLLRSDLNVMKKTAFYNAAELNQCTVQLEMIKKSLDN